MASSDIAAPASGIQLSVIAGPARVDALAPPQCTVARLLADSGIALDTSSQAILSRTGDVVTPEQTAESLGHGALLTLVDLTPQPSTARASRRESGSGTSVDHQTRSWLLGIAAVVLSLVTLADLAAGATWLAPAVRLTAAALIGVGAIAATGVTARRGPATASSAAATLLPGPLLAFSAGVLAVPAVEGSPHVALTVGLLAASVVTATVTVSARVELLRGAAGTATTLLLVWSAIWGITLLLGWPSSSAAAIMVGLTAPGLRMLPTALLDLPEGYSIEYRHFMSQRWTVRGAVPADPGPVTMDAVGPEINGASARLVTGTVMLSVAAPMSAAALLAAQPASMVVTIAMLVLAVLTVAALVLAPRRSSSPTLRWIPRAAAAAIAWEATAALAQNGSTTPLLLGGILLASAFAAIAALVPLGRGASSLLWSRLGDGIEWIAAALALPAALLAADALELIRTAVS